MENLGAVFHLELLEPDDEARLEQVTTQVADWFGDQLRWTWMSCWREVEPFRNQDLEYVWTLPRRLEVPNDPADPDTSTLLQNLIKQSFWRYHVSIKGGDVHDVVSPFMFQLWSEIPEVVPSDRLPAYAVLQLSVPNTWPIDDFKRRVCAMADSLRLRWATAGYGVTDWQLYDYETPRAETYRHVRRYPGVDVSHVYPNFCPHWYDWIRSVSWLTFVGPALADRLDLDAREIDTSLLSIDDTGDHLLIQAGDRPRRGDINRLDIPAAYIQADTYIRAVRASTDIAFGMPWTQRTTEEWLRRFEVLP
jgi:hypothetical protein